MRGIRRTTFLLVAALAAVSTTREGVAGDHAAARAPEPFSIVVTLEQNGISAECERGCAWKRLTASYPNDAYQISHGGIAPVRSSAASAASFQSDAFAIVVRQEQAGVRAGCLAGCNWKELDAAYPRGAYRITHEGVEAAL